MAFISNQFVFGVEDDVTSLDTMLQEYLGLKPNSILVVADSVLNSVLEISFLSNVNREIIIWLYKTHSGEPTTDEADKLAEYIRQKLPDIIVAIGGGSTIDLAKAGVILASEPILQKASDLQGKTLFNSRKNVFIAVPTTCGSGAEATKSAVLTNPKKKLKRGINSNSALPNVVILDSSLLLTLPQEVKISSYLDALTHSIESNIGANKNLMSYMFSKSAFNMLFNMADDPKGLAIQSKQALTASHFAGKAICNSETGPVHALSYYLSEELGIPHGIAVGVLLPEVIEYYAREFSIGLGLELVPTSLELNRFLKQIRNLAIPLLNENMQRSILDLDINSAAKRSIQLTGAISNAPIVWGPSQSLEIYKKLISLLR